MQVLDRIPYHGDAPSALEQAFGCEAHTIFRDHAKYHELDLGSEAPDQFVGVSGLENVERLFLQKNLLVAREILRQGGRWFVGNRDHPVGQSLRNQPGAGRALHTMRRKGGELRIVWNVKTAVRDQKNLVLAGGIGKTANVWQQFFGAGHIKLPARQHEIGLNVHFPENKIARYHTRSVMLASL